MTQLRQKPDASREALVNQLRRRLDAIGAGRAARNWRGRGSVPRADSLLRLAEAHLVSVDWLLARPGASRAFAAPYGTADLCDALRAFLATRLVASGREERLVTQLLPPADELLRRLEEDMRRLVDDAVAISREQLVRRVERRLDGTSGRGRAAPSLLQALRHLATDPPGPSTVTSADSLALLPEFFAEETRAQQAIEYSFDGQAKLRKQAQERDRARRKRRTAAATKGRKAKGRRH